MDRTGDREDELGFLQHIHLRADDKLASCVDLEPVSQDLKLFLVPGDEQGPGCLTSQQFRSDPPYGAGGAYHSNRRICHFNIHDLGRLTNCLNRHHHRV